MVSIGKKLTGCVLAIIAILIIGAFVQIGDSIAYAEDDAALTVQKDGKTVKTFTMDELQQIADEEGNLTYNYSKYNSYGNPSSKLNVQGPTVEAVLNQAGITKGSIIDDGVITLTGSDGYHKNVTKTQLFENRYYYPNGLNVNYATGITADDREGRELMPAVIDLMSKDTCFCIGQTAPGEQSDPVFVKKIALGGKINVTSEEAPRCKSVTGVTPKAGTKDVVPQNTEITIAQNMDVDQYEKIYYTIDGSSPNSESLMYNYDFDDQFLCKPVLANEGQITIKVRVKDFGKKDSVLQTFTYYVGAALTVKVNGVTKKVYTSTEELIDLGEETYDYSGSNTYPTPSLKTECKGVRVGNIIKDATGLIPGSTLNNNAVITFIGTDNYKAVFTAGQLFADRYCFPNAEKYVDRKGGAVRDTARLNSKIVPAIIGTEGSHSLLFGQIEPNEQNFAECVDDMLTFGTIEITTNGSPGKCHSVTEASPEDGAEVVQGQKIEFPEPYKDGRKRDKICYVIDSEEDAEPGLASGFYNYSAFRAEENLTNPPIMNDPGTHTIKVKVIGYGKLDGDVTSFTYKVIPKQPASFVVSAKTYNSVSLKWTANTKATGYKIYRNSGSGYSLIKTITSAATTSYKNTSLKTGTAYKYMIKAYYEDADGEILLSDYRVVSATPSLSKPTVTLTSGTRKATVKWKKITGASGYEVYRSTKKSSGFKKIKTAGSSTVSYTNTKLTKGKYYYYKIRAYRTVSGKKVYSSYSTVKYVKVK